MKPLAAATVLSLSLFLTCSFASAQGRIYKWTDPQGRVHYSDAPVGNAESVDDALPPASSFATPSGPVPPATASTEPAPEPGIQAPEAVVPPPGETAEAPAADGQPAATEPTTDNEPGLGPDGPVATGEESPAPASQASAELLETSEPDDPAQDELDTGEPLDADATGEESAE